MNYTRFIASSVKIIHKVLLLEQKLNEYKTWHVHIDLKGEPLGLMLTLKISSPSFLKKESKHFSRAIV